MKAQLKIASRFWLSGVRQADLAVSKNNVPRADFLREEPIIFEYLTAAKGTLQSFKKFIFTPVFTPELPFGDEQ